MSQFSKQHEQHQYSHNSNDTYVFGNTTIIMKSMFE